MKTEFKGPFNTKVKAETIDKAAAKILKKFKRRQCTITQDRTPHRFTVKGLRKHQSYLVHEGKCIRTSPSHTTFWDFASKFCLEEVCRGINFKMEEISPHIQKVFTMEQAMLKVIDQNYQSACLWHSIDHDVTLRLLFAGRNHDHFYINENRVSKIIELGFRGQQGTSLTFGKDSIVSLFQQLGQEASTTDKAERKALKKEVKLLKKENRLLKSQIKLLKAENELLRQESQAE